jgi:hypothetical protein
MYGFRLSFGLGLLILQLDQGPRQAAQVSGPTNARHSYFSFSVMIGSAHS